MMSILNEFIDGYIKKAKNSQDRKIARHLKEIVPQTTHLDENIYNKVIEEMIKDRSKDFKCAFSEVCKTYFLRGDILEAQLPDILTRIILNKNEFAANVLYLYKRSPSQSKKLKMLFASGDKERIIRTLKRLRRVKLARREVVFATFDEKDKERDPFLNYKVTDIIKMLALDTDIFDREEPYTAVKIRYKSGNEFDKRYPTFLDAGWWDKFFPAAKEDDYGRTKNLDPLLPGMPEVVHENMELSEIAVEDIEFLEDR